MDLDACLVINGKIHFAEFKRKYPASDGKFGIDHVPHGSLIKWLTKAKSSLKHIILCDPLWDKNSSPLHLIEAESPTAQYADWLGADLRSSDLDLVDGYFQTSGTDSGMFEGERWQYKLPLKLFKLLRKNRDSAREILKHKR